MKPVAGIPLLQYLLERVSKARKLDAVLVATSDRSEDEMIAEHCLRHQVRCFRGSLSDVAGRFAEALRAHPAPVFIRVNGDSPLIDPRLIDLGLDLFFSGAYDIVTNVFPKSYPAGQSVEILRTSVFLPAVDRMMAPADREHVTPYFYRHARDYHILNFTADRDFTGIRLAVDTHDDFHRFCDIIGRMQSAHWMYGIEDIARLCRQASAQEHGEACIN